MNRLKAWDYLWIRLGEIGVISAQGEWFPMDSQSGVNWGKSIAGKIDELQKTRLTYSQIVLIAELLYEAGRAASSDVGGES